MFVAYIEMWIQSMIEKNDQEIFEKNEVLTAKHEIEKDLAVARAKCDEMKRDCEQLAESCSSLGENNRVRVLANQALVWKGYDGTFF